MNKVIISIIVPVYKAEKYLSRCVGSILEQTFTDFELILVDDGSPDNSGALCDRYALKDKRIKVIHKENGGASSARNVGLDVAQGKYITFIDSDDWISKNYLKVLVEPMEKNRIQLVVGAYEVRENRITIRGLETKLIKLYELSAVERVAYYDIQNLKGPCAKLFLSSTINENNLRFPLEMKYGEDTLFVRGYLAHCECIYTAKEVVYYYNKYNELSQTKQVDKRKKECSLVLIEDFYKMLKKERVDEKFIKQLISAQAFESFNYYVQSFILSASKPMVIDELKNSLKDFEKYLNLDLDWAKKEDSLFKLRQAVLKKDCNEIYDFYQERLNCNKIRKFLSRVKWNILRPYIEKNRDKLNKYKYLDK